MLITSSQIKGTAQGLVSQHIKALTDQAGSSVSKFASENPGIETSFRNPFHPRSDADIN